MVSYLLTITSATVPLIGIFAYGWSPFEIAYLWFAEALVFIPLMAIYRLLAKKPVVDTFHIGVYAFWMIILTFLFVTFTESMGIGNSTIGETLSAIRIPLLFVIASQITELAFAHRRPAEYFVQNSILLPMLTLHLTVVLGLALLGLLDGLDYGSTIAGVILVIVHFTISLGFHLKAVKATL